MTTQDPKTAGPQPTNVPYGERTVHIDTAREPLLVHSESSGSGSGSAANMHHQDVAGVLRRNQACLQCRKRKLKCDATRPHCATCVRSYRHLLRTSPKSKPVLCCDYDDGTGHQNEAEKATNDVVVLEDEDGAGKKKRKASGEGKRKKKDEQFEEERDRLTKKIEELEAQLSTQVPSLQEEETAHARRTQSPPSVSPNRSWSAGQAYYDSSTSVPSPNAFLEMLSSAASGQNTNVSGQPTAGSSSSKLPHSSSDPVTTGPMYGGGPLDQLGTRSASGFKPMFEFNHAQQQASRGTLDADLSPGLQTEGSSRSSMHDPTPPGLPGGIPSPSILSPNNVFNFSPGPMPDSGPTDINQHVLGSQWPPMQFGVDGLQPSTKVEGPWRGVETIETVFAANFAKMDGPGPDVAPGQDSGMDTEINMDGLQAGLDAAMQQQLLMDLFWPGWPSNLPEPNVVNDLIEAFFDLIPNLPRVLHRARFLARMALPPTHSNFPHPALIHAICSAAAAWCPPAVYEKSAKVKGWDFLETIDLNTTAGVFHNPGSECSSKTVVSFSLRQAEFAKSAVQDGLNTGNRLFDVVRAMIILCRIFIDDTRMLECWAYGGLVARMLLPLGLNVRSAELSLKSVMLPPPADALEREERRAAVWMAFYHDTIGSAASGWGTSIALDELSIPLPVSVEEFERGDAAMEPNPQDIESPDLWVKHPVLDSFVMVMKATILMNRVNKFARKWKNRHLRENDDFEGMNRPEFRDLANAISCFQMSFPPSMRDICKLDGKKKFDIDLIAAHMLPHAATICLYEPFADITDPADQYARRVLTSTQAIVSQVQQLASVVSDGSSNMVSRNFISVMHSSASVCLVTSARTSLMFLRHALNVGDMAAAQSHRTDCEMIRMALSQFGMRFKIGHHHAQLIEYFLDRVVNPTFVKLMAHYPDHPRTGAPDLSPTADFGMCISNALNIKRGFWRISPSTNQTQQQGSTASNGPSPMGSTPESAGSRTSVPSNGATASTSTSVSNHLQDSPTTQLPKLADGPHRQRSGSSWESHQPSLHRSSIDASSRPSTSGVEIGLGVQGQTQSGYGGSASISMMDTDSSPTSTAPQPDRAFDASKAPAERESDHPCIFSRTAAEANKAAFDAQSAPTTGAFTDANAANQSQFHSQRPAPDISPSINAGAELGDGQGSGGNGSDRSYIPGPFGWRVDLPQSEPHYNFNPDAGSLPVDNPANRQLDAQAEENFNTMRILRPDGHMAIFPGYTAEEVAQRAWSQQRPDPILKPPVSGSASGVEPRAGLWGPLEKGDLLNSKDGGQPGIGSEPFTAHELTVDEMIKRGYGIR